jgi:hypothetical protein
MIQKTFDDIRPSLLDRVKSIAQDASKLPLEEKIDFLNEARRILHEISPFNFEPIDFVEWVPAETLEANGWNPNHMADNERKMLVGSMRKYGMSQAIVSMKEGRIIDGWHRNYTGSTDPVLSERMYHYLPRVCIEGDEADQREATLLFNETKGKHYVEKEGQVIRDLVELGRADEELSKNLGKSSEELVRLKQITGIAARFANKEYSKAWGELDEMEIR